MRLARLGVGLVLSLALYGPLSPGQQYTRDPTTVELWRTDKLSGQLMIKPTAKVKTGISTEGLVGYWPFNGNAHDESGNGNDGTVFGGAQLVEDRLGNPNSAYFFDGVDDYISAGDSTILEMDSSVTMMAWIKPDFIHTNLTAVAVSRSGEYEIMRDVTDELNYLIYNTNPGGYWVPIGYQAPADEWTHIAVTYDFGLTTAYVNGELVFIYSGSGLITDGYPGFDELWIGGRHHLYTPLPFHGVIDDVRIYNRAISAEEVMAIYNEIPNDPLAQFGVSYGSTGSSEPNNPGALISIDPLTGAGTLIGPTGIIGDDGPAVRALAIKSTGEMYAPNYKASSDLYTVNASTGAGTFVANTGLLHPGDMVFNASDILYAVDETNILYTVDPGTGARTVVGPTGVTLGGLACDPTDGTIYGSDNSDGIYTIDVTTGAATLVGTTGLGGNTPDILFDQAGNLFGAKSGTGGISNYISIDKTTGSGTVTGPTGFVAVVGLASRVLITTSTIPCTDITSMAARCIGGGVKTIQVRVNLLNNIIHAGEPITIAIDESQYTSTIVTNGTHSRANFSVPGWSVGDHVVSLVVPPGCLADKHTNCVVGDDIAKADPYWDDDAEWMGQNQEVPQSTELLGNYPNPFNPSSNIQYALSEDAQVTLRVYNMLGQVVATLVDEAQTAGYKSVVWNGRNDVGTGVASGIYIYRMTAGSFTATKRMLLLK